MNKEVRLVLLNGCWTDAHVVLELFKKSINAAYDAEGITGKEYLIMKDFGKELMNMFGEKEAAHEDRD